MVVKQCHKPPMTGKGNHTTEKNGDGWGMVYGIVLPTLVVSLIFQPLVFAKVDVIFWVNGKITILGWTIHSFTYETLWF